MKKIDLLKYHHGGKDNLNGKRHFHDFELEILHVLSGDGIMMIKDKLYPLKTNTVFFVCGRDAHCSSPQNPEAYVRNKIIFPQEFLTEISEKLDCIEIIEELFMRGGCAVKLTSDLSMKTDECFLNLNESVKNEVITDKLRFFVNLLSVIDIAIKSRENNMPYIKNKISDVIGYINKNLNEKLTLDTISKKTNINSNSRVC